MTLSGHDAGDGAAWANRLEAALDFPEVTGRRMQTRVEFHRRQLIVSLHCSICGACLDAEGCGCRPLARAPTWLDRILQAEPLFDRALRWWRRWRDPRIAPVEKINRALVRGGLGVGPSGLPVDEE